MDSPEEVSSPLLHANTPDIEPEDERPITPELNLPDQPSYNGNTSPHISYEPPSPINLPTFDDEEHFKGEPMENLNCVSIRALSNNDWMMMHANNLAPRCFIIINIKMLKTEPVRHQTNRNLVGNMYHLTKF